MRRALWACLVLTAGIAAAEGPLTSPRPQARAGTEAPATVLMAALALPPAPAAPALAASDAPRPEARPVGLAAPPPVLAGFAPAPFRPQARPAGLRVHLPATPVLAAVAPPSSLAVLRSPRPFLRPPAILARATVVAAERARGQVCGNPQLQGEALAPIRDGECGVDQPVRLRAVGGVTLSSPATVDCNTAAALHAWVVAARPIVGQEGGGIARLRVAADYACRPRNNQAGGRLSEHGRGRAIDIAALVLADGSEIAVLQGWGSGDDGDQLRQLHLAACGIFGTVLGPGSDPYHRDHFHFDTASYRSGSYCR